MEEAQERADIAESQVNKLRAKSREIVRVYSFLFTILFVLIVIFTQGTYMDQLKKLTSHGLFLLIQRERMLKNEQSICLVKTQCKKS